MNFFNRIFKIFVLAFGIACFVHEPVVFANSKESSSMQTKSDDKKQVSSDDKNKQKENSEQVAKKQESKEDRITAGEVVGFIALVICIGALKYAIRTGCK